MTSASNDARIPYCAPAPAFANAQLWPQGADLTYSTVGMTSSQRSCTPPFLYCFSDDESRRTLQSIDSGDEKMLGRIQTQDATTDVAINSPLSAQSSGYSSAEDENLISPNNNSQFCPFSPDDDLSDLTTSYTSASASGMLTSSSVDAKPSSSFNLDDYIDLDPMQTFLPQTLFPDSDATLSTTTTAHDDVTNLLTSSATTRSSIEQTLSSRGLMLNNNFEGDVMEVESSMTSPPTSSTKAASSDLVASSNITISLPPGFNAQGQDGKSVLIDVLRKADKSQLMKIHEQINAAMATMAHNKENGKTPSCNPELQISIAPAQTSSLLADSTLQTSTSKSSVLARSHSAPSTPMPITTTASILGTPRSLHASASASDAFSTSPMDFSDLALLGDVDAQLPSFELLNDVTSHVTPFDDGLLNDVDMGAGATASSGVVASQSNNSSSNTLQCLNSLTTVTNNSELNSSQPSFVLGPTTSDDVTSRFARQQMTSHSPGSRSSAVCGVTSVATVVKQEPMMSAVSRGATSSDSHSIDMDAAMRGLNDHSYTSKTPRKPTPERARFSATIKENRGRSAPVLEHLLTTKRPLNPMKGSDHVAQGMQQLALSDMEALHGLNQPNLLKKLLTGEMDRKAPPQKIFHSGSILTRRGSFATPPPAVTCSPPTPFPPVTPKQEASYDDFGENVVLDSLHGMLTADSNQDLDSLWTESKDTSSDWTNSIKNESEEVRTFFVINFSCVFPISVLVCSIIILNIR